MPEEFEVGERVRIRDEWFAERTYITSEISEGRIVKKYHSLSTGVYSVAIGAAMCLVRGEFLEHISVYKRFPTSKPPSDLDEVDVSIINKYMQEVYDRKIL